MNQRIAIGQKVRFLPHTLHSKDGGGYMDWGRPMNVTGTVEFISKRGGWFAARYTASGTVQRECFKFCDIGTAVTVLG